MKIASRYLLPLELFTAVLMLSWGLSGWLGGGVLWKTLAQHGQNTEWGLWMCGVGLAQLAVAGAEWCFGRRWDARALLRSVRARFWLAFAAVTAWLYVCFLLFTLRGAPDIVALLLQAPVALAFSAWVAMGNSKVACLLDPSVPTYRLQSRTLEERRRGWPAEEDSLLRGPH